MGVLPALSYYCCGGACSSGVVVALHPPDRLILAGLQTERRCSVWGAAAVVFPLLRSLEGRSPARRPLATSNLHGKAVAWEVDLAPRRPTNARSHLDVLVFAAMRGVGKVRKGTLVQAKLLCECTHKSVGGRETRFTTTYCQGPIPRSFTARVQGRMSSLTKHSPHKQR